MVRVKAAFPLGPETRAAVASSLSNLLGRRVSLKVEEAPEVIGGAAVKVGDYVVDGTLSFRLLRLKRAARAALPGGAAASPEEAVAEVLKAVDGAGLAPRLEQVGTVVSIGDGIARATGLEDAVIGEIVRFTGGTYGVVMDLEPGQAGCVVLGDDSGIHEGLTVWGTGRLLDVPVGEAVVGRVLDALGRPVDGMGRLKADRTRPLESPAPSIAKRKPVSRPLHTGILAVDALVPIGRGQRELIIGDRQTGKTSIALDAIVNQRGTGVRCIYCAIGQKTSTVAQVVQFLKERGAMSYTTVVSAPASDPAPLQFAAPYAACAMAEEFMYAGADVLIVYDDLSKHAAAYRTMSLLLRRPPGREAYPGDIFYLHSRLLERAAQLSDEVGGGSMTALPIVETLAGDVSAYIPTNAISITDGQIFLDSDLFHAGMRPAVNVGLSVSRVGGNAQIPLMKRVAAPLRLDLAAYRELAAFVQFGAEVDAATRRKLERGETATRLLRQKNGEPISAAHQVTVLTALAMGLFDSVARDEIDTFRQKLVAYVSANYPHLERRIREAGELAGLDRVLEEALVEFKKTWDSRAPAPTGEGAPPAGGPATAGEGEGQGAPTP